MCILCVIQKWSRRIATMLPWLVLPLIGLWALSQMLPPAFRFEITSPRLACVFVLLVTLFWYEILMPKLSSWRAHRNARLRERKRNEAIELQKLRKAATRKCRNCLTAYRDQNPCGGKFMCLYCGHVSKRPVLDLPVPSGMSISNAGIIKDLVGKGGKLFNGRVWSENGWICSQEWIDNGNWSSGSFASKPVNWRRNDADGSYGGDDHCLAEKSCSSLVIFTFKMLTSFVLGVKWLWRKIFSGGSSSKDASFNAKHSRISSQSGKCVGNFHESKTEKARRKAEEKRQARQEKELLEEEERKQREEVAKLVEERRKLRGEKLEAEKDNEKTNSPVKGKDGKKEAEKKRRERKKERDRGSSKSNSDAEELEKRASKEAEKKLEWDRKGQTNDNIGRGLKNLSSHNVNRGSSEARYLDRMKSNILSSSKAFSGTNFFRRTANTPFAVSKPNTAVNHVHTHKREVGPPERIAGKSTLNGVSSEPQPFPAPKKSWHQLFTRSTPVHPSSSNDVIGRPNVMVPSEVTSLNNNQISFGLPSPFPPDNLTASSSLGVSPTIDPIFPHIVEEPELFEDPCYIPDPILLLGPISESLDNFQLDLGSGFLPDLGKEKPYVSKIVGPVSDISRPSPIESPLSRLRGGDKASDDKTWHLWGPSPLGQDGLGLIGGPTWHLNPEWNRLSREPQRTTTSLFTEDPALNSSTFSPQKVVANGDQDRGVSFSPLSGSSDQDPWLHKAFISPLSDDEKDFTCWSQHEWSAAAAAVGENSRKECAAQQEFGDVFSNPSAV